MNDIAIKVDGVSKEFMLPHEKQTSIKSMFVNVFRGKRTYEHQQVLKDISFEIKKGEFFGIVGRNGSGKSTLLKLLAGIYTPNKGHIQINGKLVPFIELGVGFNPELTGRENVFLNGALLGFNRKEMEAMYDEIVEFAELERFMDQKLKNYSSGMQVRLAFSIAIRANTDILVLDEVLAVGDAAFQRKCTTYFETLKRDKKTVVLVTHDMSAIERYCNRALMIEGGVIKQMGDPYIVAEKYNRSNDLSYTKKKGKLPPESGIKISLFDTKGNKKNSFTSGEKMVVKLEKLSDKVNYAGVAIVRQSGEYIFAQNTYRDKWKMNKSIFIEYAVELNLGEGDYFIKAGMFGKNDKDIIAFVEKGPTFTVNRNYQDSKWDGLTRLNYEWSQGKKESQKNV